MQDCSPATPFPPHLLLALAAIADFLPLLLHPIFRLRLRCAILTAPRSCQPLAQRRKAGALLALLTLLLCCYCCQLALKSLIRQILLCLLSTLRSEHSAHAACAG